MSRRAEFDPERVRELAAHGLTQGEVARNLGCSRRTVVRRLIDCAAFREAFDAGRASGIEAVAGAMFERATAGDVAAGKFWLAHVARWRGEKSEVELNVTTRQLTKQERDAAVREALAKKPPLREALQAEANRADGDDDLMSNRLAAIAAAYAADDDDAGD